MSTAFAVTWQPLTIERSDERVVAFSRRLTVAGQLYERREVRDDAGRLVDISEYPAATSPLTQRFAEALESGRKAQKLADAIAKRDRLRAEKAAVAEPVETPAPKLEPAVRVEPKRKPVAKPQATRPAAKTTR